MKLKIFTFRFSETTDGFDDTPMQEFIIDKEIIEFTEHFYLHDKTPYLTVIISYRHSQDEKRKASYAQDSANRLDALEKNAYDALRTWRAATAKQEGLPPYLIANNKQLVEIVKSKAASKAGLARINGIGESKVEKYGKEILDIMATHMNKVSADAVEKPAEENK